MVLNKKYVFRLNLLLYIQDITTFVKYALIVPNNTGNKKKKIVYQRLPMLVPLIDIW